MDELMVSYDEVNVDTDDENPPGYVQVISDHSSSGSPERFARYNARCSTPKRTAPESQITHKSLDEDGQTCTICFEPWTNSSEHRLVSLRCGHLFGRSCISRWLRGQTSRCPQCNARARKSEIRNIYAKSVKVIDTSERDRALDELQTERELRRKLEIEAAKERLKHTMTVQECEQLRKENIELRKLLKDRPDSPERSQSSKKSFFSLDKSIEICKQGNCRILEVKHSLGIAVISQPSGNDFFTGFGFRKVELSTLHQTEFVLIHQKPIKDMAFHSEDGLILTASLDKTVKITSLVSNSVVQTYPLEYDTWSCTWDVDDPTYFYCGLKTGGVLLFDIRVTSRSVKELPRFGSNTPVVSLQYLRRSSQPSTCGPFVGKLADCSFYKKLDLMGEYNITPLPCLGPFTSLSSEPVSGHFLISCRPSTKQPRVSHLLCELARKDEQVVCNPIQTILGGRTQLQLTRSKLMRHPSTDSSLLICAGDEDSHGVLVWDGSNGKCVDRLKTESPVLDLCDVVDGSKLYLFALMDKTLKVYSWNS